MGALKREVLSHFSPRESKGQLINQQLLWVGEVVIHLLTRIEGLEVESMHKKEKIKVMGKKTHLLEGVEADQMGVRMGEGEKVEEGRWKWQKWRGREWRG